MNDQPILVDVDGVQADFVGGYLELVRRTTGRKHIHADVKQYSIAASLGLTAEEQASVEAKVTARGFVANLAPLPGAAEGLRQLRRLGRVVACTSPWPRSRYWHSEREDWLIDHMGFTSRDIIFAHDKQHVRGRALVDDKGDNVVKWAQWGEPAHAKDFRYQPQGACRAILWAATHNASDQEALDASAGVLIAWSWSDVVSIISGQK